MNTAILLKKEINGLKKRTRIMRFIVITKRLNYFLMTMKQITG